MGFICYDCSEKMHRVRMAVWKEIERRLDSGEKYEDLYVEYANNRKQLLEDGYHDTERYWFYDEAATKCEGVLASSVVRKAGWTRNHSGFLVRDLEKIQDTQPTPAEVAELRRKLAAAEKKIQALKSRGLLARIFRKGE